jgi:hypothetical protein
MHLRLEDSFTIKPPAGLRHHAAQQRLHFLLQLTPNALLFNTRA